MPEQRSPLKEFRHLEEKLATVGLSPAEQARYRQLKEIVSPEPSAPQPGFDVSAAAEALKASLEPAGLRRQARPAAGPDPGSGALNQGPLEAGPGASAWDPAAPGSYDQAAWDSGASKPPHDPAAAFDLNAPPFDASGPGEEQAGAWEAGAAAGHEPVARSFDLGPEAFDAAALPRAKKVVR